MTEREAMFLAAGLAAGAALATIGWWLHILLIRAVV